MSELARAELALAKSEARVWGVSFLVAFVVSTASLIVVAIALGMLIAVCVLVVGGSSPSALAIASAALALIAGAGAIYCVRALPARVKGPPPDHVPHAAQAGSHGR